MLRPLGEATVTNQRRRIDSPTKTSTTEAIGNMPGLMRRLNLTTAAMHPGRTSNSGGHELSFCGGHCVHVLV
jgi:hypothetical protein